MLEQVSADEGIDEKSARERLRERLKDAAVVGVAPILNRGYYDDLDDKLAEFLMDCSSKGLGLGRPALEIRAEQLYSNLERLPNLPRHANGTLVDPWHPTNGWYNRFMGRHKDLAYGPDARKNPRWCHDKGCV